MKDERKPLRTSPYISVPLRKNPVKTFVYIRVDSWFSSPKSLSRNMTFETASLEKGEK